MLDDNLIKITQRIEIFKFRNFKQNPQNYTDEIKSTIREETNPKTNLPVGKTRKRGKRRAMKRHVSLLVTGVSAGKNVARPWYDDFWGRKGQSGPSPRLVQSKWRRTQARWLDHLTLRWQSLRLLRGGRRFSAGKRVSNAPLKVWKVTWHRRHTVAAFEKLVGRWNGVLKI